MKKKLLAAIAASALLCGVLSAPVSAAEYKKGDINMDGEITVEDAQLAAKDYVEYLLAGNSHILTDEQLILGNVDGVVDEFDTRKNPVSVSDAQIILCYYTDCLANSSISKLDITDYVKEYYPNFVK